MSMSTAQEILAKGYELAIQYLSQKPNEPDYEKLKTLAHKIRNDIFFTSKEAAPKKAG